RVEEALAALESSTFDAVVLDLGLPDGDGLEILRFVRQRDMDVGVVILSARDDSRDRIAGLDTGADDYVGKPFDLDELAARLRAVRRRLLGRSQPALSHEGVTLDPKSRLAWRGQGDLHLSRREFAILEALMERPSHVLSRSQLEERLYGWQEDIGSNAVEVHIHHLRAKLGADFIRTVRGLGYTLQ
ncbi:MAG TPA: DNA-binding response regulator, partial [Brevundimonas sp.]|nr:DNA-binding response regulator [Brevundimonas sp.]